MKNFVLPVALLGVLAIAVLPACETVTCYTVGGAITTESVGVHDFKRVELYTSAEVNVTQGDTTYAELVSNDDMSRIVQYHYDLEDSTFQIDVTEDCFDGWDQFVVNCYMEDINALDMSGSGRFHVMGPVDIGDLDLINSGSGEIDIDDVRTTAIYGTFSGSGTTIVAGPDTCDMMDIQSSGSGSSYLVDLKTRMAEVNLSGSGNVEVHVTDTLTGSLTGSGNISYKGSPFIDVSVTGSGQLIDIN